jgi:predicted transcriptional regulator
MTGTSREKNKEKVKPAAAKKKKKNANLSRLCSEMTSLTVDAVDKEIINRFKTKIDTAEEDITKTSLTTILRDPKNVDLNNFHEGLQPYVKHYLFMAKREKKIK